MTHRMKSIIFIGITAFAALLGAIFVLQKASEPMPGEYDSPALKISKQRSGTTTTPAETNKTLQTTTK